MATDKAQYRTLRGMGVSHDYAVALAGGNDTLKEAGLGAGEEIKIVHPSFEGVINPPIYYTLSAAGTVEADPTTYDSTSEAAQRLEEWAVEHQSEYPDQGDLLVAAYRWLYENTKFSLAYTFTNLNKASVVFSEGLNQTQNGHTITGSVARVGNSVQCNLNVQSILNNNQITNVIPVGYRPFNSAYGVLRSLTSNDYYPVEVTPLGSVLSVEDIVDPVQGSLTWVTTDAYPGS